MIEKPPILRGTTQEQIAAIRDYLFRMAKSLEDAASAEVADSTAYTVTQGGQRVYDKNKTAKQIQQTAGELRDLIIKTAKDVTLEMDRELKTFESSYVAKSELYGTYTENIQTTIETTARGVVESYDYDSQISSVQDDFAVVQRYLTAIDGEIRRGIVLDPSTNQYVTGIAISQELQFSGVCDGDDPNNPGDGYTYYYMEPHQTFGLYTSDGWQFWIDGYKVGWFDSHDSMLHVKQIVAEESMQIGAYWQVGAAPDGSEFTIVYIGG